MKEMGEMRRNSVTHAIIYSAALARYSPVINDHRSTYALARRVRGGGGSIRHLWHVAREEGHPVWRPDEENDEVSRP